MRERRWYSTSADWHRPWRQIHEPVSGTHRNQPGAPHGMCMTLKDRGNAELLSFISDAKTGRNTVASAAA